MNNYPAITEINILQGTVLCWDVQKSSDGKPATGFVVTIKQVGTSFSAQKSTSENSIDAKTIIAPETFKDGVLYVVSIITQFDKDYSFPAEFTLKYDDLMGFGSVTPPTPTKEPGNKNPEPAQNPEPEPLVDVNQEADNAAKVQKLLDEAKANTATVAKLREEAQAKAKAEATRAKVEAQAESELAQSAKHPWSNLTILLGIMAVLLMGYFAWNMWSRNKHAEEIRARDAEVMKQQAQDLAHKQVMVPVITNTSTPAVVSAQHPHVDPIALVAALPPVPALPQGMMVIISNSVGGAIGNGGNVSVGGHVIVIENHYEQSRTPTSTPPRNQPKREGILIPSGLNIQPSTDRSYRWAFSIQAGMNVCYEIEPGWELQTTYSAVSTEFNLAIQKNGSWLPQRPGGKAPDMKNCTGFRCGLSPDARDTAELTFRLVRKK